MPTIEERERRNGSQGLKLPYMLSLKPEQGGDASSKSQSPFEHFIMTLLSTSDYIDFIQRLQGYSSGGWARKVDVKLDTSLDYGVRHCLKIRTQRLYILG